MINLNESGEGNIAAGSGNVAKVAFQVKAGVSAGTTTTIQLTNKESKATLATREFEIAGAPPLAIEDHTWSIAGSLQIGRDTNDVYIAVTNEAAISAATLELHYDADALQFLPFADPASSLINRASDLTLVPNAMTGFVRMVLIDISESGLGIQAGSGQILHLQFGILEGTAAGNTTLRLTTKDSKDTLATQQLQIEEDVWSNPGDPEASTWSFNATIAEQATQSEIYINVSNSKWLGGLTLDVAFDSTQLEPVSPVEENVVLLRRASDMNLALEHTAGSGHLRLIITSPSSQPPFPVIDVGNAPVASLKFNHLAAPAGDQSLTFTLTLEGGDQLASKTFTVRAYAGPSADVDGDGQTSIFDLLDFLQKWSKAPPSVFTDVNGDGKTDVFDLLAILGSL